MNVLFVNSAEPACGVHQFGLNLWRILKKSERLPIYYCAPANERQFIDELSLRQHEVVFFNFYPCTFPWLTLDTLTAVRATGAKLVTIFHEVRVTGFDAYIYPDPTFAGDYRQLNQWFPMGRPLPESIPGIGSPVREIPLISTSGFGFAWKGHERLTQMVVEQFARATLRLHLPFAKYGDADGTQARAVAQRCREIVAGTEIELQIDHEFMEPEKFVSWLAESDLNAYLYDEANTSRGIASTTDHALAARRPLALTRTRMFRHLHSCEGIFVEDHTLPEIMAAGTEPLEQVYREFSEQNVLAEIENILCAISREKFCRMLTNRDREHMAETIIPEMREKLPEMMGRKIPEANVQQAWTVALVRATNTKCVLCVGCFEDTGFELLQLDNPTIIGIDAAQGTTLRQFRDQIIGKIQFKCVFATSVIEHVRDDDQFIRDLCDCLVSDGVCILTADFKEGWQRGQPLPATDERFYTSADIARIGRILREKNCYFVDHPDTTGAPDFHYQGHDYSFIGLVFKKL